MGNYNEKDLMFLSYQNNEMIDGDLIIENGDFKLTGDYESARQDLVIRARTIRGEMRSHPELGAQLEDLIGKPNHELTAMEGAIDLYHAYTHDERFRSQDIKIRPVPLSINELQFYVFLNVGFERVITATIPIELG